MARKVLTDYRNFSISGMAVLMMAFVGATVSAAVDNDTLLYRKCCLDLEGLAKVTDELLGGVYFRCISRREANRRLNGTAFAGAFVVGDSEPIAYGFPEGCARSDLVEREYTAVSYSPERHCLDKVVVHLVNESVTEAATHEEVVALACELVDDDNETGLALEVERVRKCCPDGAEYDVAGHACRQSGVQESVESLVRRFVGSEVLHEVQIGLQCKSEQYSMSFTQDRFDLTYGRRRLAVRDRVSGKALSLHREEYCVERAVGDAGALVARGCTDSCAAGATCVRKCCPAGQHYEPKVCGRGANKCVPGDHRFTPPFYTGRYMAYKETSAPEMMGAAPPPKCKEGRYALSNSTEDEHFLLHDGQMVVPKIYKFYPTDVYCVETVDRTMCPDIGRVTLETILCFEKPTNLPYKFTVSFICIGISCVFLVLTLIVYAALPELRNLHGMTLMCHVSAMLLGYACLARVQYGHIELSSLCKLHGYVIYFAFVAAFSWLCVMCFDIWWTFGSIKTVQRIHKVGADRRRFAWYSLCAWGAPVLLTVAMLLLDLYPISPYLDANIGENFCWFGSIQNDATDWPHYIFFVVPMGLVTGVNLVLWVCTARHCARVKSELHRMQAGSFGDRAKRRFQADRAKYTLVVKLWVVMGAGWVWEVLSTLVQEPRWLWLGVDLINELQGLFIFIILVLKPKVFFLVRKRLGLEKGAALKNGEGGGATSTRSTFLSSRSISSEERALRRSQSQQNARAHAGSGPPPPAAPAHASAHERHSLNSAKAQ